MSADAIVVGGGAIGVSCALELARAGAVVTLIEAGPEVGAGCSAGNAGLVCPSHAAPLATRSALASGLRWSLSADGPFALRPRPSLLLWLARFALACTPERERRATDLLRDLSRESLELFAQLRDEIGVRFDAVGSLHVFESPRALEHGLRVAAEHGAAGLRSETLTAAEAAALEPALHGPVAGAIYYPDDLSADPLAFVRVVGTAAAAAGVDVRTGVEVLSVCASGDRVVALETTAGTFKAGAVVLAAGSWTRPLVRGLGLSLPVEGGKGYHVDYDRHDGDPRISIFLDGSRVVVTPLPDKLRLAGTLELTGLDLSVDRRRVDAIARAGQRSVPALVGRPVREVWRGLRPCAPDGVPIVGRTSRYRNLVVATAHAMLGFTLAPVTGRIVARIVTDADPEHDLSLLSPDRFGPLIRRASRSA